MQLDNKRNFVITIGRQFGSGGRELGRMLADRFGIEYYDKKLLLEAASRAGMSPEVFERNDERMPNLMGSSVGFNMGYGQLPWYNGQTMVADSIYSSLTDVIEHLADTRPCVIVGRSADCVLRSNAVKTDKLRAAYYNFYTDKKWGDSASYDLTFDSSVLPMEDLCDMVAFYIRRRFGIEPVRKPYDRSVD